ncbi:MAG TPA: hypothetical protein VKT49_24825 [Bryobacteraceae bacterium]|nr:hypothetical protein [Bryobacteraceae bacterium]
MKRILTTTCMAALLGAGIAGAQTHNANDPNPAYTRDQNTRATSNASKEVTQDTKTITNSGTTTKSTDTVYGKIESYDLNKSMKVSAPGKVVTSKTFDLSAKNETVNAAPGLKVGDWVSVRQQTDNNGHKTITIERSTERASR